MHVGETELAALVGVGQALVIEAEAVEDRRLEVVDINGVFDDVETGIVRCAAVDPRLDGPPAYPGSSRFLEVFKACNARLDVPHNTPQFMHVPRFKVGLQPAKQGFHVRAVPLHEAGDIGFVN